MGLNDYFTAIRGQILMMEPKPPISKVFNLVSQEERQRSMKYSQSTSAVVFQTSQSESPSQPVVAAYVNGYNTQKPRPICSYCRLSGHTVNRCYKLHGYPQGYKTQGSYPKPQNQSQQAQFTGLYVKPQQSWP